MALPLWVFSAIEGRNIQADGGFSVPYTVVLENGKPLAAYSDLADTHAHDRVFRHEYDLSNRAVKLGLGLKGGEGMNIDRSRGSNRVVTCFAERVVPKSSHVNVKNSFIHTEYLTTEQSHNFFDRGAAHLFPTCGEPEFAENLRLVSLQRRPTASSSMADEMQPLRSGLLQRFPSRPNAAPGSSVQSTALSGTASGSADNGHSVGILLRWRQVGKTTVVFPATPADEDRVVISIHARANISDLDDKRSYPYEKGVTVDGPKQLSKSFVLSPSDTARVRRASELIIRAMLDVHPVAAATLFFRLASGVLYFAYAAEVHIRGEVEPLPVAFKIPTYYRAGGVRPRTPYIYEEDEIDEPSTDFMSPSGHRQRKAGDDDAAAAAASRSNKRPATLDLRGKLLSQGAQQPTANCLPVPLHHAITTLSSPDITIDDVAALVAADVEIVLPHEDAFRRHRTRLLEQENNRQANPPKIQKVSPMPEAPRENPKPDPLVVEQIRRRALNRTRNELAAFVRGDRDTISKEALSVVKLSRKELRFIKAEADSRQQDKRVTVWDSLKSRSEPVSKPEGVEVTHTSLAALFAHSSNAGRPTSPTATQPEFSVRPVSTAMALFDRSILRSGSPHPSVVGTIRALRRRTAPVFLRPRSELSHYAPRQKPAAADRSTPAKRAGSTDSVADLPQPVVNNRSQEQKEISGGGAASGAFMRSPSAGLPQSLSTPLVNSLRAPSPNTRLSDSMRSASPRNSSIDLREDDSSANRVRSGESEIVEVLSAPRVLAQLVAACAAARKCPPSALRAEQLWKFITASVNDDESQLQGIRDASRVVEYLLGLDYHLKSLSLERSGSALGQPILFSIPENYIGQSLEEALASFVRSLPFVVDVPESVVAQQVAASRQGRDMGPVLEACIPDDVYASHLHEDSSSNLVFGVGSVPNPIEQSSRIDRWLCDVLLLRAVEALLEHRRLQQLPRSVDESRDAVGVEYALKGPTSDCALAPPVA